jgi:hypothetical protein
MKKIFLSAFMLIGLAISAHAQEFKNAIGLRLGDNDGFGAEITYQRSLSDKNRIEVDLGLRSSNNGRYNYKYNAAKLVGLYQWVWDIDNGFKWYAGPGIGVGSWHSDRYYDYGNGFYTDGKSGVFVIATGDIGIEYNFDFPLQLSFDFRPEIYLGGDYNDIRDDNFGPDFGLSARYRF